MVGGAVRGRGALEGDNKDILNPDVRIGPALLEGPDTPLQLEDRRPPSEPILQGGPVAPVEPTAPAAPAAPPAPVPPAPTPITPTAPDVDVDFLPGAGPVETQAFLAAQEPLVNPAIATAPVTQQRNLVRERFERDAAVAAMPIQGELPITPVAQEIPPIGFPAAVPALQGRVDPSFIPPSQIELPGAQNPLRPTVRGEEALFVNGRAVPVRQLLEKSEQRKEALEELHNCLSKKG